MDEDFLSRSLRLHPKPVKQARMDEIQPEKQTAEREVSRIRTLMYHIVTIVLK
jgi:hypothetical protein